MTGDTPSAARTSLNPEEPSCRTSAAHPIQPSTPKPTGSFVLLQTAPPSRRGRPVHRVSTDTTRTASLVYAGLWMLPVTRHPSPVTRHPSDRLAAALILASWSDPEGLLRLAAWAEQPETLPPGAAAGGYDMFPNADLTMHHMADALSMSLLMEDEGDEISPVVRAAQRRLAVALLGRFDRDFFAFVLSEAVDQNAGFRAGIVDEIRAAVTAAMDALLRGDRLPFQLAWQTLDLLSTLFAVDESAGLDQAERLVPVAAQDGRLEGTFRGELGGRAGDRPGRLLRALDDEVRRYGGAMRND